MVKDIERYSLAEYKAIIANRLTLSGIPQTVGTQAEIAQAYEDGVTPQAAASYLRDRYLDLVLDQNLN